MSLPHVSSCKMEVCVCVRAEVCVDVAEVDMLPGCVLDAPEENIIQCFSQKTRQSCSGPH